MDNNIDFEVTENIVNCGVNIKVIGVGGAGGNMINHIINTCNFASNIDLLIANTDLQDINKSKAEIKIQLGIKKTNGRGAGMIPEVGRISAEEAEEEIKKHLIGTELLFIAAGLGGGTGTGAAPVIARIAKSLGILVVSVVTIPFKYEQKVRTKVALEGLVELKKESDCVIQIQNDKLIAIAPKNLNAKQVYAFVDEVLVNAVSGIINVLLEEGDQNIDFADVRTIMTHRGIALMGMGKATGENAIIEAYENAIDTPLLDTCNTNLSQAKGIIVFFKYGVNAPFLQLAETMTSINSQEKEDCKVICGHKLSMDLDPDTVEVTIIATGFDETREEEMKIEEDKRAQEIQESQMKQAHIQRVSGGINKLDYKNINYDEPTFIRRSKD
ncbi:cell division protein FtsZ [Campylobacter sp. MG1]|uniref:cell division protein FtsZ n=1 Tax=Campylobacter sp. MG1 TaxID=2976332 RepID=UPI00226CF25F|nr:cell division protein FtsZ [Campylobacter sp. MG1]